MMAILIQTIDIAMLPIYLRLLLAWLLLSTAVYANPLPPDQVPEPLKPWVGWVLDGQKDIQCPYLYNESQRQCAWPGQLNLQLTDKGGTFTQHWQVYGETTVRLPGDAQHWPQQVRSTNDQPLAILEENGYPITTLSAGSYDISGQFLWDSLPEALFIAPASGLVSLTVNGKSIEAPEFNEAGSLWLSRNTDQASEDNLEIQVFRKIVDAHPLTVTTRIQLRVAGKQRNIELTPVLLNDFIPLHLNSPLPTRMNQDGKLQVQLRPGEWTIELTGRAIGAVENLPLPQSQAPWPSEEVWVFAADSDMRQVQVEGVNSVDPNQTRLPSEWASLPAYLLTAGNTMKLVQQHRGLTATPAQLNLQRQMWLDFDGKGYSLQDSLNGTLAQQSRLEVIPDIHLGRVSIAGEPQLITQQDKQPAQGVEVRQRNVNLQADSRYEAERDRVPVSGWQQELQQVNTTLHLPPGWLLFAATGTDNLPATWLQQWSLLDLFLVTLITVATGYLYGWPWGAVAGVAIALTWHQYEAPRLIWLNLLAVTALLRVVPQNRLKPWLERYRWLSLLVLVLMVLAYAITTVRIALYPQLQYIGQSSSRFAAPTIQVEAPSAAPSAGEPLSPPAPAPITPPVDDQVAAGNVMREEAAKDSAARQPAAKSDEYSYRSVLPELSKGMANKAARNDKQIANLRDIDPNSMIQTGPGLPAWQWNQVELNWSGVIKPDEQVGLWLIPPAAHSLLQVLGVLAILVLGARLALAGKVQDWLKQLPLSIHGWRVSVWVLALLPIVTSLPLPVQAEDKASTMPEPALLQTLQERLLRAPDCLPACAQIDQMNLLLRPDGLTMQLRVHTATEVAVPLPGSQSTWLPTRVLVDNAPTQTLRRDDEQQLWVVLAAGQHDVLLQGNVPTRSTLALPLPLKPHHVQWQGDGWQVEGIRDNGVPEDQLQINRTVANTDNSMQDMPTLPAFVKIERRLDLGLDWYVTTMVTRISDSAAPISLSIPLLKGEQPLSEQFTLKDNAVQINLKPQQDSLQWTSRLPQTAQIKLTANSNPAWLEEWYVAASPVWHVDAEGLPVNTYTEDDTQGLLGWKPWAGETLTLNMTRPAGAKGQSITLLASSTQIEVGKRARDISLRLTLDSSRGTQHAVTLPDKVELKSLSIDGNKQAIQQQQGKVILPLLPRKQEAVLEWQEEGTMPVHYAFPSIDVGLAGVNSEFRLSLPQDRWVLWVNGPLLGPAVLFWGVVAVLLVFAILLGRSGLTPLKSWQWFLLGIGLSQSSPYLMVLMALWLIALALRGKYALEQRPYWQFNALQTALVLLTIMALAILIGAVANGLLGNPHMQIAGNASSAYNLVWYQDRTAAVLPQPSVISVPMLYYRLFMLAWALWLTVALLGWLRWGWQAFSQGGLWQNKPPKLLPVPTTQPTPP